MGYRLSETWIKASITGTIWAASEIVLGSFLHNLRVPFSGNILTGIGIIILISISYKWTEKGLFWRAGLICALMKTMSPSAVIFGPMIAIFTESLLMEFSARVIGRNLAGYIMGSMMAMSWNLVQKIVNYIIFYGSNIIEVYSSLLKFAQKQLDIRTEIVWLPIIVLLIVYALLGFLAAVTGISVGRRMMKQTPVEETAVPYTPPAQIPKLSESKFRYSVSWLLADFALIIISFVLLSYTKWMIWSITITCVIIIWSFRYQRALRQLSKPKFWIFFVLITLITAFVFTRVRSVENPLREGLLTGFQMNFRAALIIVGFSVLGTELYNPVIRNFFTRTSFKNLPLALELSAESLPLFIASIPDFKTIVRNPVAIFCKVISHADARLAGIKNKNEAERCIFLITGGINEGKTTFIKKLIERLKSENIHIGGILSERVMIDNQTTGYDIINITSGERRAFLRQDGSSAESIGRFTICPEGLARGNQILNSMIPEINSVVVIDEVGLLELQNRGWSESLKGLLERSVNHLLLTVRDTYIKDVTQKWKLKDAVIFDISSTDYVTAASSIKKRLHER